MSDAHFQIRNLVLIVLAAAAGAGLAVLLVSATGLSKAPPAGRIHLPYPHVVPKTEDNVALRFAMVHDVIHERFPRHGSAYYKERNRRALQELDNLKRQSERSVSYWAALDDLAVGLEMTGEHDEAIRLMRAKLAEQEKLGLRGRDLYSSYANLGTFLILGPFRQVRPGNADDKRILREGLDFIRKAIEVYPESHFGREIWQAAIIEYMIALYDNPQLLLHYDMVGNDLSKDLRDKRRHPLNDSLVRADALQQGREAAEYLHNPATWQKTRAARGGIATVGAEMNQPPPLGTSATPTSTMTGSAQRKPVPFDEPTLGIVGMWRLGGGAHPYFAVALGEIMLRVGQDHIAWCAFERAARMAEFAWPDKSLQQNFHGHCRRRQEFIASTIGAEEVAKARKAFDTELAFGQGYQRDYQRYEEERIKAGRSIDDPHFYDDFNAGRPPIASTIGEADWFHDSEQATLRWPVPLTLLGAGVFGLAAAFWFTRVGRR